MAQTVIQAFHVKRRLFRAIVLTIFLLAAAGSGVWLLYMKFVKPDTNRYDDLINRSASKYCIDPCLLKAVIWRESGFDKDAAGGKGEVGLMQIMPGKNGAVQDWANNHGVALPSRGVLSDPELNIEIGSWYLSMALRTWTDYKDAELMALCEYNAGPKRAKNWKPASTEADFKENIKFRSTKSYVGAIMKKCEEYRKNRRDALND